MNDFNDKNEISKTDEAPAPASPTGEIKPKRPASTFQRILEHGISFAILTPAIGGFLVLLLTIALMVPDYGAAEGVIKALAMSSNFLGAAYVIGLIPSLLTGLAVYPLWRQFGSGWEMHVIAALINCAFCTVSGYFLTALAASSTFSLFLIGMVGALAALASLFMTKRLRQQ